MTLDEMLEIVTRKPGRSSICLSDYQRRILETPEKPLWVIAGPGSGKTETLVLRCLRLIYVSRVNPRSILITTFTEKAAREMEDRLTDYAAWITQNARREDVETVDLTHVRMGTLHSLCNDILQEYRYLEYQNVRLMDALEQLIFIKEHADLPGRKPRAGSTEEALWTAFAGLLGGWPNQSTATRMGWPLNRSKAMRDLVGRIVEYRVDVDQMRAAGGIWTCLADGYDDYVSKLQKARRSDFSHVQATFYKFLSEPRGRLFLEGDGTAEQPGVQHVLVDEYQDTNPIQEAIYLELARREPHNLMVVGDDDQAIFRFRGGTVESLIGYNQSCERAWALDATEIQPIPLYDNFRSHERIVRWCNHYVTSFVEMQRTGARAPFKQHLTALSSINEAHGDYPSVALITGPKVRDVARVFAQTIMELLDHGVVTDPSDCALLLPSTRETAPWAKHYVEELGKIGIRAYNPRSKKFLEQSEVQTALGALTELLDPGIGACPPQLRKFPQAWRNAYQQHAMNNHQLAQYVTEATAQIASKGPGVLLNASVMELFYILLSFSPFTGWQQDIEQSYRLAKLTRILEAYTAMPRPGEPERTRNWLSTGERGHEVSRSWRESFYWGLVGALELEDLDDEEDEFEAFPAGRLPIMTIHQAKGLQFPFVFVGTKEGISPTPSGAHTAEDLLHPFRRDAPAQHFTAEERAVQDSVRQFYVAHSRAQYGLVVLATHAQRDSHAPHLGPDWTHWHRINGVPDLTLLPVRP